MATHRAEGLEDAEAALLRDGYDVIRVGYSDVIGTERGRDILVNRFARTVGDGVAFCRSVYGTTPMGDVVPIAGGLDAGLPDVVAFPDLATIKPVPWEPGVAHCHRRRLQPGRHALGGKPAQRPQARRRAIRRPGHEPHRRTGAGVLRPRARRRDPRPAGGDTARPPGTSTSPASRAIPRMCCCARCATSLATAWTWSRPTTSSPAASSRSTCGTPRLWTPPTGHSASRRPSRNWPGGRASSPRSWPSRSTTRAAPASTSTSPPGPPTGAPSSTTPRAPMASRPRPGPRSPGSSRTPPPWPPSATRRSTPTSGSGRTPWRRGSSTGAWTTAARWSASHPSAAGPPGWSCAWATPRPTPTSPPADSWLPPISASRTS